MTATSAGSAWAVGFSGCGCKPGANATLIVRWNGKVWKRVPSPSPAGGAYLRGAAAVSVGVPGQSAALTAARR